MMNHISKKSWVAEEDLALLALVEIHGAKEWSEISSKLVTRSAKQCRERYHNHLQPNIKKGCWSAEEDQTIFSMQPHIGNQWAKIAKLLPGRTDNAVKNRWHAVIRSRQLAALNQTSQQPAISAIEDAGSSNFELSEFENLLFVSAVPYESDSSSSPSSTASTTSAIGSSSNSSNSKKKVTPAIPSLSLSSIILDAPMGNSMLPQSVKKMTGGGVDMMLYYHDHCHDHHTEYRVSDECSEHDVSEEGAEIEEVEMMYSGRTDSTFNDILGELVGSFDNQIVGDNSDLYILSNLSARSDLIHDDAVISIAAMNPSISEHCLSARADLEYDFMDGCSYDCDEMNALFQSPRKPWWEEDVDYGSSTSVLDTVDNGSSSNYYTTSGKPQKSRLSVANLRSPRSPALLLLKRLRA